MKGRCEGKITKTVNSGTSERSGETEGLESANSVAVCLGSSSDSLWEAESQKDNFPCLLSLSLSGERCINVSTVVAGRTFDMSA
jgi:hypothetical protein